jgi:hypothetical protein
MDLYNLPKDMLVKMVSEIREESIKESDERNKKKYHDLIDTISSKQCKRISCFYCNVFIILNYSDDNDISDILYKSEDWIESFDDFKPCDEVNYRNCTNYFCKKHFDDLWKVKTRVNGTVEIVDVCYDCYTK